MELCKIGKKRVITIHADASINEASKLMRENHIGDVVVVEFKGEHKIPVGILTDRDVVMSTIALSIPIDTLLVEDIMTRNIVSVQDNDSLIDVINIMKKHGVKRVPIVDKDKDLCGIISVEDIISLLADELNALTEISKRQREVEIQKRKKIA